MSDHRVCTLDEYEVYVDGGYVELRPLNYLRSEVAPPLLYKDDAVRLAHAILKEFGNDTQDQEG